MSILPMSSVRLVAGTTTPYLFGDPAVLIYPSNESAFRFTLSGHDVREVRIEYPFSPEHSVNFESISPIVVPMRFKTKHIYLGPFDFKTDSDR